jgi:Sodium/hydrogen exchanger family
VLFADASRIRISDLRADLGRCVRLLGLELPLTIAFGAVAGYLLLGISPWYALLLGAALAPTDAALGSAVMSDQRVPQPIRRVLNVESGLNDGIATPVVMVALAGIATEAGLAGHETPGRALLGLLLGGFDRGRRRRWRRSAAPSDQKARLELRGVRRTGGPGPLVAGLPQPCWPVQMASSPHSSAALPLRSAPAVAGRRRSTTSNKPVACRRWSPGCCSEH